MIFQPISRLYVKRCCDKSIRSHIGLENLQFCVISLVTLQIGTFEHLTTQNTMLQNPYFFCLFSSKTLNCCINMLLLCIADIIGIYKDFLNKKGKEKRILKHCILCGKVFISTDLQSPKRDHTKL